VLIAKAASDSREPRPAPAKVSPVRETVTLVLEQSERPLQATEIYVAACELAGEPLLRSTVRSALSAGSKGDLARFRRLGWGVYEAFRY